MATVDDVVFVRSWAAEALGRIGDREDYDLLVSLLEDPSLRVQNGAISGLGRLGDPRALTFLRAFRRRIRRSPGLFWWHSGAVREAIDRLEGRWPPDDPSR